MEAYVSNGQATLFVEVQGIKLYQPVSASYLKELAYMSILIAAGSEAFHHYWKETDMCKGFDSICGITNLGLTSNYWCGRKEGSLFFTADYILPHHLNDTNS